MSVHFIHLIVIYKTFYVFLESINDESIIEEFISLFV